MDGNPRPVPRHVWLHCIENGALAGASVMFAAALPARWLPTLVLACLVLAAGVVGTGVTFTQTGSVLLGLVVTAWTLLLASWSSWARYAGVWHWRIFLALVVPVMMLTAVSALAWSRWHHRRDADAAEHDRQARVRELRTWTARLARLGVEGVRAEHIDAHRGGRSVYLRLPESGRVTIAHLEAVRDGIDVACKLPPGSASFEMGKHAGEAVLHLNERDIMAQDVPFPPYADGDLLTIREPLAVGLHDDGRVAEVSLREVQALVIAPTGSGKSNLLNVLLARLTRCVDVIVWVIDLKGGRLVAPWLRPWLAGEAANSPIDWVATTRDEAERMLRAAIAWMEARMSSLSGGSKITPSNTEPQLVIVGDEIADIFGTGGPRGTGVTPNTVMVGLGEEITRKGRSEAFSAIWTTGRGTVTMIGSGDLKSQCALRFALMTPNEADAASIVPGDTQATRLLTSMTYAGSGLIWRGRRHPQPVKFWRLDADEDAHPEDLDAILVMASAAASITPAPEERGLRAMGAAYEGRWARFAETETARSIVTRAGGQRQATGGMMTRAAASAAFTTLTAGLDLDAPGEDTGMSPARLRVYSLLAGAPPLGLTVGDIAVRLGQEGFGTRRETVSRWLNREAEDPAGRVERDARSGMFRLRR